MHTRVFASTATKRTKKEREHVKWNYKYNLIRRGHDVDAD